PPPRAPRDPTRVYRARVRRRDAAGRQRYPGAPRLVAAWRAGPRPDRDPHDTGTTDARPEARDHLDPRTARTPRGGRRADRRAPRAPGTGVAGGSAARGRGRPRRPGPD